MKEALKFFLLCLIVAGTALISTARSQEQDVAYTMCPLAMDMFDEKPNFRWVGLMHRDGNALAINNLLNTEVNLATKRKDREPAVMNI